MISKRHRDDDANNERTRRMIETTKVPKVGEGAKTRVPAFTSRHVNNSPGKSSLNAPVAGRDSHKVFRTCVGEKKEFLGKGPRSSGDFTSAVTFREKQRRC